MGTFKQQQTLQHSRSRVFFPLFLLLLSFLVRTTNAQLVSGDEQRAEPSSLSSGSPTSILSPFAAASAAGISAPTGYGGPSSNQANQGQSSGILNYYFLLLAVFIVVIAVAYCTLVRRRRRKVARSRNNGQNALAQDLEGWAGGRRWGHNRWRSGGVHEPRAEEGLDERGEAPPPYLPGEPPPVHLDNGNSPHGDDAPIPLRAMHRDEGKPPDYE